MDFELQINGLREMEQNLVALGAELGGKALRGALMDAAKPLQEHMIDNVPEDQGPLKQSIKKKSRLNKTGSNKNFDGDSVAIVSVGSFGVFYAHMVEFGTQYTAAQSFVRKANEVAGASTQIFQRRLKRRTELAQKKLAKRGRR